MARADAIADLESTLSLLRKYGVKHFKDANDTGGVVIEFFPPETPPTTTQETMPPPEVDLCACGCPQYAHVNGLCVQGCAETACAPPPK